MITYYKTLNFNKSLALTKGFTLYTSEQNKTKTHLVNRNVDTASLLRTMMKRDKML